MDNGGCSMMKVSQASEILEREHSRDKFLNWEAGGSRDLLRTAKRSNITAISPPSTL